MYLLHSSLLGFLGDIPFLQSLVFALCCSLLLFLSLTIVLLFSSPCPLHYLVLLQSKAFVENVPLVSEFQAHNGEVVSLEIIDEPYSLLSCASDRSCCIWDPTNFKLIGELAFDVKARGRQRV